MGAKKTAQCRRLVIVTASIAAVIIIGLAITVWNILTTSDTTVDGFGVVLLTVSGIDSLTVVTLTVVTLYVSKNGLIAHNSKCPNTYILRDLLALFKPENLPRLCPVLFTSGVCETGTALNESYTSQRV